MSVLDVNMPIFVYLPPPSELLVYTIISSADNRRRNNETVLRIRVSRWHHFEKNEGTAVSETSPASQVLIETSKASRLVD